MLSRPHLFRGFACDKERATHIDAHDRVEVDDRCLPDRTATAEDPGAGNCDVYWSDFVCYELEGCDHHILRGHVALDGNRATPKLSHLHRRGLSCARFPIDNRDISTELGED
jgi:hypothetical protein